MNTTTVVWPDASIPPEQLYVYDRTKDGQSHRYMRHPECPGVWPGPTTVLRLLGLSKEGLIKWSTNLEREACLAAAGEAFSELMFEGKPGKVVSASVLKDTMAAKLAGERAHVRALEKAGDIGTQVHDRIRWFLAKECGQDRGTPPKMSDEASRAYVSFTDWWYGAKLKPIRVEQPIWDPALRYAGSFDLLAEDPSGSLDLYDFKSGKGIYLEYHLQLAAYLHAARHWEPRIRSGSIIRLPKTQGDSFNPERDIELLGERKYEGRTFTEEALMESFACTAKAWWNLCANPDFKP